jgi:phosphatidylserine decarboxylase
MKQHTKSVSLLILPARIPALSIEITMLTKYGLDVAIPILIIALAVVLIGLFTSNLPVRVILIVAGAAAFIFTLNFFRDPDRSTPSVAGGIISPADGKIVNISEVEEDEYIGGKVKQVCIFMSPLNVHVNRFPVNGKIEFYRYVEGQFFAAFEDKASDLNERTLIGVNTGEFKVLFKQIAGFVARRIVCPVAIGDSAVAGERFGMIKFGSRVDVLMPLDAEVLVKMDQHVVAGETVLAIVRK